MSAKCHSRPTQRAKKRIQKDRLAAVLPKSDYVLWSGDCDSSCLPLPPPAKQTIRTEADIAHLFSAIRDALPLQSFICHPLLRIS